VTQGVDNHQLEIVTEAIRTHNEHFPEIEQSGQKLPGVVDRIIELLREAEKLGQEISQYASIVAIDGKDSIASTNKQVAILADYDPFSA
jgi:hypothetical protein